MNEDLFVVPGYPNYKIKDDGSTVKVVSYAISPYGRDLTRAYEDGSYGYRLSKNGVSKFFSVAALKQFVKEAKGKTVNRNSVSGVVKTGDWIVGSIDKQSGKFSTSAMPAKHPTEASAKSEAARLAEINKGSKYVVLNVKAIASVEQVSWE